MRRQFCGVVSKVGNEYILEGNGEDFNLSSEFQYYWYNGLQLTIKMNNNRRQLLHETGEILFERDENRNYMLHINNINVEQILQNNIQNLIEITVDLDSEDRNETNG